MKQRPFNLNPTGRTVYKVTHPAVEAARQRFVLEPMRFIPHKGRASKLPDDMPPRVISDADRLNDAERGSANLLHAMRVALR
jgi:hypothetical protein